MLAEAQYILLHTIALPGDSAPIFDLIACLLWPMIHPKCDHFGKPVEVWCNTVFEPEAVNQFCLASIYNICSRYYETLCGECVQIAILLIK